MLKYTVGEHWRFQSYSISLSLSNLLQFYYFARTYLDNLRILYLVDKAQPLHLIFIYQVMSLTKITLYIYNNPHASPEHA